ncbi:MAG TPA: DEAD/DEAH box helicase [Candidatus Binatia bacterium]|nr:DEAD/DEAH box helicase [Candidatus Binatia bacterium]
MDDAFELLDPQAAQDFLKRFPLAARRKGEACFRGGRVRSLVPEKPGRSYSAQVLDGQEYGVRLDFDQGEGWDAECSCPQGFNCEHAFAAMSALLAEHNTAAVRGLSAGLRGAVARLATTRVKPGTTDAADVARRLTVTTGRSLTQEEKSFLKRLHSAYVRCNQNQQLTNWDLQQLGFPQFEYSWSGLNIWPEFPPSEYEFWLYIAHAVLKKGGSIPDFMLPITDLSLVEERLAQWRRSREVERWKKALGNLQQELSQPAPAVQGEIDLQLVVDETGVRLQWRRPGRTEFEPIKQTHFRQLRTDLDEGLVSFSNEAELIWEFFSHRVYYANRTRLDYDDAEATEILGRMLRIRMLDSRIVRFDGQPLARPAEPLRWELTSAAGEQDDYRLRMVQADGAPLPPVWATFPGRPALYLTADAVFTGPDSHPHVLEPGEENLIPAPALERASGVALLQSLGVELPPRVRERVRTLPFEVAIQCELKATYPGSDTEDCVVTVMAEAPDGYQRVWSGEDWTDTAPKAARKHAREDDPITVYDSAALQPIARLLEPLNLKPRTYGDGVGLRINNKFGEVFAGWLKTVPPHITVHLQGELASFVSADVAGRVKLDVTEAEIDWFDLRVVLDVADTTLTADEIKLLLNAKGRFVRLAGKGWRRLQYDLSEEENERLARLGLSTRELSAEPQRLHALQLADDAAKKFLPEQQVEQIQRRVGEIKARVAPDLPAGVSALLRPYQLEGFHFLAYLATNRFGGILADDMGLGKTLQTLAWLLWLRERPLISNQLSRASNQLPVVSNQSAIGNAAGGNKAAGSEGISRTTPLPSLVVCPKSVMDNWHAEAARFTAGLRVRSWSAGELPRFFDELGSADLHVLNYSQLRSVGENLVTVRWQAVILDEGQYIKNPSSQTAQVARALRAEHRLVLTGTPIENRLLDLWSLMAYAMPGVLGSRGQFAKFYDAKGDPFARRRLASRVRPFVLRRTKAQVAKDLPDRVEEDLLCEIEGEQQALYRAELKRAQQLLLRIQTQQELARQQFHFLTSLLRLRQICCHPRLVAPDSAAPSAKTEALLEQLEPIMEEGQKVLVFSQFVEMLNLLRPVLAERNWPLFYLAGDTENRGELVKNFQETEGPAIFLISLKAGGFGLNLTAASYVVLFDPWWNPAVENQAIDRTHRIGQSNKVMAYRLLIKNSIEEKIRALHKQKRALAEDVLGEEKFAQSLTLQDLQFLFAD